MLKLARRLLAYLERLPFRFGQSMLVTFERDHPPIDNKRDPQLPTSEVPDDVQRAAIEKLRRERADRQN